MILFALKYWKYLAVAGCVLMVFAWHTTQVNRAWHAGQTALRTEQAAEAARRNLDANKADDAARSCANDPACRMRDDGYRRD